MIQWSPEGFLFGLLTKYARSSFQHRAKVRLIRIFAQLLRQKTLVFEHTGRIQIDALDYIGWALLTQGSFEPRSITRAMRIMRNADGIFLDVGAHHGLYVVAVGAGTSCKIVAVEASASNFQRLCENVHRNPGICVSLVNCCATPSDTLVQLSQEPSGRSAWTRVDEAKDKGDAPFVAGLPLDRILKRLNVKSIRLLKIDVEGYEAQVFRGLSWESAFRPTYVLMECNPSEIEKRQFLLDLGYIAQTVDSTPLDDVKGYPEGNLLFVDKGTVGDH